jgi:O-antigen/teichoic acid export membrane protein
VKLVAFADLKGRVLPRPRAYRALFGRMSWTVVDQALSSVSNFVLGLIIARLAGPAEFGAFTIAYIVYVLALGISRSCASDPLMVRSSHLTGEETRRNAGAVALVSLALGIAAGILSVAVGMLLGGSTGRCLVALGVFLPALLVQDAWRFVFFTTRRPAAAAANDGVWLIAQLVLFVMLASGGLVSGAWMVVAWGLGAVPAVAVGLLQIRPLVVISDGPLWFSRHRDLSIPFIGEFLLASAGTQLTFLVLGAVAGLAALGGLRAAQLLFGPLTMVFLAIRSALIPEAARSARHSRQRLRTLVVLVSVGLCAAALAFLLAVLALPATIKHEILGDTWSRARTAVLPLGLALAAAGLTVGPSIGLRSLEAANRGLAVRLVVLPVTVALALCGVLADGGRGAAYGLALAAFITAVVCADQFRRALTAADWVPARLDEVPCSSGLPGAFAPQEATG